MGLRSGATIALMLCIAGCGPSIRNIVEYMRYENARFAKTRKGESWSPSDEERSDMLFRKARAELRRLDSRAVKPLGARTTGAPVRWFRSSTASGVARRTTSGS